MAILKGYFVKPIWPGIKKYFEDSMDPNSQLNKDRRQYEIDKAKWDIEKAIQLRLHNGVERRMVIGHGESIAVIECDKGQLYFQGIPREFL